MLKVLELASIVAGPLLRILVGSNRIRFHVACEVLAHSFDWQLNMPDAPLATRDRRPPSGSLSPMMQAFQTGAKSSGQLFQWPFHQRINMCEAHDLRFATLCLRPAVHGRSLEPSTG